MPNLLIVDDDKHLLELYQDFCTAYGHSVETTNCPQRALQITLEKTQFDVIITDFHMPVWSGLTLALKIRNYEMATGGRRTPILCITGNVEDVERMNKRDREPIDMIVCKGSFKMLELDAMIRKMSEKGKNANA